MNNRLFYKSLKIFISVSVMLLVYVLLPYSAYAAAVITRSENLLDENLVKEDQNFASPTSVIVFPIERPDSVNEGDRDWFKALYYFYTARLGFPDIPFHFIVGSNGDVYEGNKGGDEQSILVQGEDPGALIVGYLVEQGESNFSARSYDAVESILLDLANRNAIKPEKIKITGLETVVNLQDKTVFLRSKQLFGSWNNGMKEVLGVVSKGYRPVPKTYSVEVVEAVSPADEVSYKETSTMTVKLRNTGEFSIYQGTGSELLGLKKDGEESKFFVNGVWASPSQPTIMSEGTVVRPGEEKTFTFKLKVPLFFGEQSETFIISNVSGQKFEGSDFTIKLNIATPAERVVEILPTDTGYLNVRGAASGGASVITKVNPGQRYILLADSNTGWYQIDLGDGRNGWIARQYASFVN